MIKFSFSKSTYLRILTSKEVTIYWHKAVATSLGYLYPSSEFGINFLWAIILNPVFNSLFGDFALFTGMGGPINVLKGEQICSNGEVV